MDPSPLAGQAEAIAKKYIKRIVLCIDWLSQLFYIYNLFKAPP
jgi:hypothetical protein